MSDPQIQPAAGTETQPGVAEASNIGKPPRNQWWDVWDQF